MIEHCAKRCIILNRRLHESGILNAKVERLRGGRAYSRPYSRLLRDHPKPSTHSFCAAGKRKHEARRVVDQFEIVVAEQGCPALSKMIKRRTCGSICARCNRRPIVKETDRR